MGFAAGDERGCGCRPVSQAVPALQQRCSRLSRRAGAAPGLSAHVAPHAAARRRSRRRRSSPRPGPVPASSPPPCDARLSNAGRVHGQRAGAGAQRQGRAPVRSGRLHRRAGGLLHRSRHRGAPGGLPLPAHRRLQQGRAGCGRGLGRRRPVGAPAPAPPPPGRSWGGARWRRGCRGAPRTPPPAAAHARATPSAACSSTGSSSTGGLGHRGRRACYAAACPHQCRAPLHRRPPQRAAAAVAMLDTALEVKGRLKAGDNSFKPFAGAPATACRAAGVGEGAGGAARQLLSRALPGGRSRSWLPRARPILPLPSLRPPLGQASRWP